MFHVIVSYFLLINKSGQKQKFNKKKVSLLQEKIRRKWIRSEKKPKPSFIHLRNWIRIFKVYDFVDLKVSFLQIVCWDWRKISNFSSVYNKKAIKFEENPENKISILCPSFPVTYLNLLRKISNHSPWEFCILKQSPTQFLISSETYLYKANPRGNFYWCLFL